MTAQALGVALSVVLAAAAPPPKSGAKGTTAPPWAGEELPLALKVKTPEELALKAHAEKQYLLFNLLAGGKAAWDAGDFASAAGKWEALLRLPGLPAEVDAAVRPFAIEARKRAGGASAELPAVVEAAPKKPPEPIRKLTVSVSGRISGGGALGPGGTVVLLHRSDGPTPRPRLSKGRAVIQRGKAFVPRVLAVPVGSTVEFRNEDEIYHNVFSLTRTAEFDLGLYEKGLTKERTFDKAGPVQLLCNIHSSMQGWVYAVDTPWYTQADGGGAFSIKGVPPGEYVLQAWHEAASAPTKRVITVGPEGAVVNLDVAGDKPSSKFVPDKYGKPRQPQLGY